MNSDAINLDLKKVLTSLKKSEDFFVFRKQKSHTHQEKNFFFPFYHVSLYTRLVRKKVTENIILNSSAGILPSRGTV